MEHLNKMFGFIFKQPIHKTLRQMRLVSIGAIYFCGYMMWDMWVWYKSAADLKEVGDTAFLGFAALVLGTFWKAASAIIEQHKDDDG